MTTIQNLIRNDGAPFESSEIQTLSQQLDALSDDERAEYSKQNTSAIAQHSAARFLIVSGPGTGKSYLFLERMNNWYKQDPQAKVFVTSFVRKLVADLQSDIKYDDKLTEEQKRRITVSTLHKFARSLVEKNHGSSEWAFRAHFRIIGQTWKHIL